jgi:hypothetical protein
MIYNAGWPQHLSGLEDVAIKARTSSTETKSASSARPWDSRWWGDELSCS